MMMNTAWFLCANLAVSLYYCGDNILLYCCKIWFQSIGSFGMSLKKWKSNSYYCTTFLSVWKCWGFRPEEKNAPKASKAAHLGSLEAIWGTSVVEAWGKCSICQDFQNETTQAMLSQEGEGEKSPPIQSVAKWCKSMLEIVTLCLWRCFHR